MAVSFAAMVVAAAAPAVVRVDLSAPAMVTDTRYLSVAIDTGALIGYEWDAWAG
jgi:hypothetical protein